MAWWLRSEAIVKHTLSAATVRFYSERLINWCGKQGDACWGAIVLTQVIPVIGEWHRR
jgi:hypothetical protein